MAGEAITWANIVKRSHEVIQSGGRRVTERVPQTATYGSYDAPVAAPQRWRSVIDPYGNDVRVVITTAAADVDTDGAYARRQRAKWRFYGWFEKGHCPCALFLNDQLFEEHFVSQSVLADAKAQKACAPGTYSVRKPCQHALVEIDARRAKNLIDDAERQKNFQSESDKLIAANAKNSQEIVTGVAGAMAGAIKDAVAAMAGKDKK